MVRKLHIATYKSSLPLLLLHHYPTQAIIKHPKRPLSFASPFPFPFHFPFFDSDQIFFPFSLFFSISRVSDSLFLQQFFFLISYLHLRFRSCLFFFDKHVARSGFLLHFLEQITLKSYLLIHTNQLVGS
ncbi:hypothetical protein L6452_14889 [Arctium lappa]|uniref:Uncharacterized protein n=1 Tax=Arctium lappa TaxID=4217 RepID=A0ACB9CMI5_ARCLA|nr:hypothetical protein L6452_14889 [Arctium lappa]